MSLTGAMNTAISGLSASQSSLALVSQNIANANNPDYKRKAAVLETVVADGVTAGVKIAEIERFVDEFLLREMRVSSADFGRYDAQTPFLDRLQNIFGRPSAETTLTGRLDRVFATFETAGSLPDNAAARSEVVFALKSLIREIGQVSTEIETLRGDIESQITDEISEVNEALERIAELNDKIVAANAVDRDASEFLDQRDTQLARVAERIGISSYEQSDGRVVVMAGNGTLLVDTSARVLDYRPATSAPPGTVFDDISVRRASDPTGSGTALGRDIQSGRLRGLLDLRDGALEDTATSLGEFAARLADELNRVHNDNIAFPPPNGLTGSHNTGLVASDSHNFTGKVTFSVIDPDTPSTDAYGVVASVTVDFDAGTVDRDFAGAPVAVPLTTIQDVIDAVNGANGLNGAATLALGNGVMTFTAAAGRGVGIAQDATAPSSRGGRGFSHFFGLNDLMTAGSPTFFEHGFAAGDAHLFSGDTDFTVLDANGEVVTTVTFTPVAGDFTSLVSQLNAALAVGGTAYATFALDPTAGRITMTEAAGFTVLARDQSAPSPSDRGGTGIGLATLLGFGVDKTQRVAATLTVEPAIDADVNLLALGKLQGAAINDPGATAGDSRGAQALATVATANVAINAAGGLSARTTTLSNYAGAVISDAAIYADETGGLAEEFEVLFDTLERKSQSLSGVNVDEELSNMIVLQNAYSASARVISTISRMFDDLLAIAR
jgi:flagellar hook-associated protein 1 FlgK